MGRFGLWIGLRGYVFDFDQFRLLRDYVGEMVFYFGFGFTCVVDCCLEFGLFCYVALLLAFEGFGFVDYYFVM